MSNNIQSISDRRASSTGSLVPRAPLNTAPFTPAERDMILVEFYHLGASIPALAAQFGTGYGPIQQVLRFGFFRAVGKRRKDMAERGKVAA